MAYSVDALIDTTSPSFDFTMGDASGHLIERIAAASTTSETALTYGAKGYPESPYTAITYNGSTSTATSPSNTAFDLGDVFSVMSVFSHSVVASVGTLMTKGTTGGNGYIFFIGSDDTLRLGDASAVTDMVDSGSTLIRANQVYVGIATKNGTTRKMYVNGIDVTSLGTNVTLSNTTSVLTVGNTNFAGTIYRMTGWKSELTATQAKQLSAPFIAGGLGLRPVQVSSNRVGPPALRRRWRRPYTATGIASTSYTSSLTGGLSFTGSQVKQTGKSLTAGLSFTGSTLTHAITRTLTAGLSFTGAIVKSTARVLTGGLSFSGSLRKQAGKTFTAGLSFTGSIPQRAVTRILSGGLSFTGVIPTHAITHALTGALSFTGNLRKQTSRTLTGSLSFTGAVTKQTGRILTGGLSFTGGITRQVTRIFTAGLSFTGAVRKATSRTLTGALSFAGQIQKATSRILSGGLSVSGALNSVKNGGSTAYTQTLTAALSFAGSVSKRTSRTQTAALSFTGAVTKQTSRTLTGAVSFAGSLQKQTGRLLAGGLSFAGTVTRRTSRTLTAGLSFTGSIAKGTTRTLTGVLSFSGSVAGAKNAITTVIGGFPPVAAAVSFISNALGRNPSPGGDASNPTPGGDASNPKPRS